MANMTTVPEAQGLLPKEQLMARAARVRDALPLVTAVVGAFLCLAVAAGGLALLVVGYHLLYHLVHHASAAGGGG